MKFLVVKSGVLVLAGLLLVQTADAQRTGRGRNKPAATDTTGQGQQVTNQTQPSGYNPYGNIPIRVDSSGMTESEVKKSLRNDNAFDKSNINDRTPLPYEHLRWDDALFAEKVWREIDLREKINKPFTYEAESDNGSQVFVNMLLKAVNSGQVRAFTDERFTTPMSASEFSQLTVGSADTVARTDINDPNKVVEYVVTRASFDAKSIVKIRVKEEWVFDREASRMFVRILGICPLKTQFFPNGKERGVTPMFWIYYPDLRPFLAKYEVYNSKNMGNARMTWEELFESRMFGSYIIKSTFDNAANKAIKGYIKDPILALLEGENIKEKIFNYEQDLWSY